MQTKEKKTLGCKGLFLKIIWNYYSKKGEKGQEKIPIIFI